jgi:hypothetical protein
MSFQSSPDRQPAPAPAPPAARSARRRRGRRYARRPILVAATARPGAQLTVPLDELERQRRLSRVAAYLVRTMRACPAPGIAPLTTRDWLLLGAAIGLPVLLWLGLASVSRG